jgi:hypothetical protein
MLTNPAPRGIPRKHPARVGATSFFDLVPLKVVTEIITAVEHQNDLVEVVLLSHSP